MHSTCMNSTHCVFYRILYTQISTEACNKETGKKEKVSGITLFVIAYRVHDMSHFTIPL